MKPWIAIAIAATLISAGGAMVWITSRGQRETSQAPFKPVPTASPIAEPSKPQAFKPIPSQPSKHPGVATQVARRAWATNFLATLGPVSTGKAIEFELLNGQMAAGTILRQQSSADQLIYISGQLTEPASGRFFFHAQTLSGVAGPFFGVVELPSLGIAYRVEPAAFGQGSELVRRPLRNVVCMDLPPVDKRRVAKLGEIPPLNPADFPQEPIPGYQNGVIMLESLHGAKAVIYLDFEGGYTESWGGVAYQRSNFGNADIFEIWRRVSEDYMPFNINVTTDQKAFEGAAQNSRQRVIVTPTETAQPGAGGAAYVGSFDLTVDTPCWVFETEAPGPKYAAEACAHEAGHTLGLIHDGQQTNGVHFEYFYGQGGANVTGWAPIMGVAYYDNVTQWCKGEYLDANNLEDQLLIVANQNNVRFRPDDTGSTLATSRYLEIYTNYGVSAEGVIETTGDTDAFQFTTTGGEIFLQANPSTVGPNLAIAVSLYDSSDTLLGSNEPQDTLWASLSTNVPAGTYTFRVTGSGRNDPLTNGFSSYGSLGYYSITGRVANARLPNRFSIPEYALNGTAVGVVSAQAPDTDKFTYSIISGNRGNTFAIDNTGTLTVANNALLDYEILATNTSRSPVQFELFLNILDDLHPLLNETNRRVLVAVTNVNEPPIVTGFVSSNAVSSLGYYGGWVPGAPAVLPGAYLGGSGFFEGSFSGTGNVAQYSAAVLEHAPPGTGLGALLASDPDFYTVLSYSIIGGNENSMFAIDNDTGILTVAGDPTAAIQNQYNLTVAVSDQTPPVPLMATSMVSISVELPYARGGIAYAAYTNLPGSAVSDLTSASSFPLDPAFEFVDSTLEGSVNESDPFGGVMRGYLLPPATGLYTFWIASQDDSELWLGASSNSASMQRIAFIAGDTNQAAPNLWTNYPSKASVPVPLRSGYVYYLEARLKAGTSSNYLGVAWACPSNGIAPEIVPGQYLSPFRMNYVPHPLGFTANLPRNAIAGYLVGTVSVSDVNSEDIETLALLSSDAPGAFSLDPTSGAVRLVDESVLSDTNRSQFRLAIQATDDGVPPLSGTNIFTVNLVPANTLLASGIAAEIWTNIPGTAVSNLTNEAKFPRSPDLVQRLTSLQLGNFSLAVSTGFSTNVGGFNFLGPGGAPIFSAPVNLDGDPSLPSTAFGARIRGYLTPTNTGLYTFFISSADDSVLLLSPTTNPAAAQAIAAITGAQTDPLQWASYRSQQSSPQWLSAGSRYYFEALLKTGGSNSAPGLPIFNSTGHLEVGWTGPGLPGTNVIDGAFLSPIDLDYAPTFADETIALPITAADGTVVATLAAQASAEDTLSYKIISGNVSNTFALNPDTGALSVMDNSLFANYAISNFTLVVEVQDSGYGGLYPLKSALATITLTVVDNSPAFIWSGGGGAGDWSLPDNWHGSLPNDHSKLVFQGTNQIVNNNDFLQGVGQVKLSNGGFYLDGNPLVLHAGLQNLGTNSWAVDSTLDSPQTLYCAAGKLTIARALRNTGYQVTFQANSTMVLDGEVSGSGGLIKTGGGALVIHSTNSYTGPTDVELGTLLLASSGSISASSTINIAAGATLNVQGTSELYTVPAGHALTGNGTVVGPIFIAGKLAPALAASGPSSPQAMLFSNRLSLAGETSLTINQNASLTQTIKVAGEVRYGGVLTVSPAKNETFLSGGQTFRLFDATNYVGSFSAVNLPLGYEWDTSQLSTNGSIRLIGSARSLPPNLAITYSNGTAFIRFESAAAKHYVLESKVGLQRSPVGWGQSALGTGTGGMISIPVKVLTNPPQRFFRIWEY